MKNKNPNRTLVIATMVFPMGAIQRKHVEIALLLALNTFM